MVLLVFVEASLQATVTYLVIQAGKDIATGDFKISDFLWIVLAQAGSYVLHGVAWIFGEQAGFSAHARYIAAFSRANRHQAGLLADKAARERVEPFLTNETFHLLFELMYELEGALQLFFGLLLSALVIGHEIDAGFPLAYALIFILVMTMQYVLRRPVANAYLQNQRQTNRLTAQTYTAWDNIFSGNRYNFSLWLALFKQKLRNALRAQINAIVWRESMSTVSGVLGLLIIFTVMAWVVKKDTGDVALLVGLAATLPKQIDMTHEVHRLAIGWNDLLALWVRAGGVMDNMKPDLAAPLDQRIRFDSLHLIQRAGDGITDIQCTSLRDALTLVMMQPTGRINVRGNNGSGKSTLLIALKEQLRGKAYYWPTIDRLAFRHTHADPVDVNTNADDEYLDDVAGNGNGSAPELPDVTANAAPGFSSGEKQIAALAEIVKNTRAAVYLLDEWDANLDAVNRERAQTLIDELAARARVVEISHRDGKRRAPTGDHQADSI